MTYLINLSQYFIRSGYETLLIGTGENYNGNGSFSYFKSIYSKSEIGNFIFFLRLFGTKAIEDLGKEDIIHVQRPEMVIPLRLRRRNRIICTLHGGQDKAVFSKKGMLAGVFYSILLFLSFLVGNEFIVVDELNYRRYLKMYPWLKKKMRIIPISIETGKFGRTDKSRAREKFGISPNRKVALFVGRLEYEKNVEFILDCYSEINEDQNYQLFIVGTGTRERELKEMARPLGDRIVFMGELRNDELPELYTCADVLILTSFFEGSPTVVKEALCSGVPVLSTDVGDVRMVLDSIDGGVIIERDCRSFLNGLKKIEDLPPIDIEKAKRIFNVDQMGKKTQEVYFKAL